MKTRHLLLYILLFAFCTANATAQNDSQAVRNFENEEADFIAIDLSEDEAATLETTAIVNSTKTEEDIIEAEITAADSHYHGWVAKVVQWYSHHVGYTAVGALMTIESSFIPFPSEIVIPPAVMVAADPQSPNDMKILLIVLIGTLGALLGAYINYFLSRWLGRPIIYKFVDSKVGHALRLSGEKMERAEKYFNDHGVVSTLVGRLIPVIRQLISIPAGLSKMNVATFTLYTFLGAAIWNCVLALLGYLAVKAGGMEFIFKYSGILSKVIIILFVAAVIFLIIRAIIKKSRSSR
jgi:membrane protein DedA with SNARE-associated domain